MLTTVCLFLLKEGLFNWPCIDSFKASIDPGILPRNLDQDPPYPSTSSDGVVRGPMPRDLKVRSDVWVLSCVHIAFCLRLINFLSVRVKYCSTCKTYRPPRSSHCKMVCPYLYTKFVFMSNGSLFIC
jgi:hypothetical protein